MTRGLSKRHQQASQQNKDIDVHELAKQIFQSKEFIEDISSLITEAIAPLQQRVKLLFHEEIIVSLVTIRKSIS
ncbi:unnamed protein product [Didymodactylos carnosus]|uniref:Uncharacterized protein n=1 Tax=Didymodactylos carnosus TaxID=1234261 RepID=A0A8S2RSQ9_9BILA|nr:unnamed protein product [Didymodactylos carnosus]CAF4167719.1 unnamed protein product [Didymodactylos carnosus]